MFHSRITLEHVPGYTSGIWYNDSGNTRKFFGGLKGLWSFWTYPPVAYKGLLPYRPCLKGQSLCHDTFERFEQLNQRMPFDLEVCMVEPLFLTRNKQWRKLFARIPVFGC